MQADQQNNKGVNFTVVGSDCGLLMKPVPTDVLTMSIAERWEVVVDFAPYAGQNVTMHNQKGVGADADFDGTDRVMRFVVGKTVTSQQNNGAIPSTLREVPFPPNLSVANRQFEFASNGGEWHINGIGWHDVAERVLAPPKRGSIEIWELKNGGGGWTQ